MNASDQEMLSDPGPFSTAVRLVGAGGGPGMYRSQYDSVDKSTRAYSQSYHIFSLLHYFPELHFYQRQYTTLLLGFALLQ